MGQDGKYSLVIEGDEPSFSAYLPELPTILVTGASTDELTYSRWSGCCDTEGRDGLRHAHRGKLQLNVQQFGATTRVVVVAAPDQRQ